MRRTGHIRFKLRNGPPATVVLLVDSTSKGCKLCFLNCRFTEADVKEVRRLVKASSSLLQAERLVYGISKKLPPEQVGCFDVAEDELVSFMEKLSHQLCTGASLAGFWANAAR